MCIVRRHLDKGGSMEIKQAFTFDDVLLTPAASSVLPNETDTRTRLTRKVKNFEAGMVVNPVTIHPDETLADALRLMADNKISGIPVVERGNGPLPGLLTQHPRRFPD